MYGRDRATRGLTITSLRSRAMPMDKAMRQAAMRCFGEAIQMIRAISSQTRPHTAIWVAVTITRSSVGPARAWASQTPNARSALNTLASMGASRAASSARARQARRRRLGAGGDGVRGQAELLAHALFDGAERAGVVFQELLHV